MNRLFFILLFSILISSCGNSEETSKIKTLPYYGHHDFNKRTNEYGETVTDTIYHKVPRWSFLNQDSALVKQSDYKGHIYISDFFFANCPVICPLKTEYLNRIQISLKEDSLLGRVRIISHTVDPEKDSIPALKKYAVDRNIDTEYWDFLYGEVDEVYNLAMKGYLISVAQDSIAEGGILHTDAFILVDGDGHLRGVYDGTDKLENQRLLDEIKILIAEEDKRHE